MKRRLITSLLLYTDMREEILQYVSNNSSPSLASQLVADLDDALVNIGQMLKDLNHLDVKNDVDLAIRVKLGCMELRTVAEQYRSMGQPCERLATLFSHLADWLEITFSVKPDIQLRN